VLSLALRDDERMVRARAQPLRRRSYGSSVVPWRNTRGRLIRLPAPVNLDDCHLQRGGCVVALGKRAPAARQAHRHRAA
jgi:hypothetical protein